MNKIKISIYFIVCLLITSCIGPTNIEVGAKAPAITGTLTDGTSFELDDLNGQYVLIEFWGSWCPPCLAEAPKVVNLYKKYKNKKYSNATGFEVLSIALERNNKVWPKAIKHLGIDWKYQLVDISKIVATSTIANSYGVYDIPAKFLLDPQGKFISIKGNIREIEKLLDQNLAQ